jgi:hypothetical protein
LGDLGVHERTNVDFKGVDWIKLAKDWAPMAGSC